MRKETLSFSQATKLGIMFIMGSTLVMGTGGAAGKNTWISIILATTISIPAALIYSKILSLYPGQDLFEILEICFGKYLGKFIGIIFIWFSFHLGALVLRNFGQFIITVALPETPMIFPIALLTFACIVGLRSGIETIGRFSELYIIHLIGLIVIFTLMAIPFMPVKNLLPIAENGIFPIIQGAFAAFTFPFGETVILTMILPSIRGKKPYRKMFLTSILVGGSIILIITLRNIMILGEDGMAASYFPSYVSVSRVNIGTFLQRLEIAVSVVFLIGGFVKISACLLGACKGFTKVFNFKDYRFCVVPIAVLMALLSIIIYSNMMEMTEWAFSVWTFYALPFQLFLPIIIWIAAIIKNKTSKNSTGKLKNKTYER